MVAGWPSRARMDGRDSTSTLPAVAMARKRRLKITAHESDKTRWRRPQVRWATTPESTLPPSQPC